MYLTPQGWSKTPYKAPAHSLASFPLAPGDRLAQANAVPSAATCFGANLELARQPYATVLARQFPGLLAAFGGEVKSAPEVMALIQFAVHHGSYPMLLVGLLALEALGLRQTVQVPESSAKQISWMLTLIWYDPAFRSFVQI